ncbi:galactokinase [Streptomyces mashuensis]|uniref:Galactokinase n=1 Tax=Streptomyces mashuensis TaxID=33904 RepID=A0A919B762_9ACTN|nr:galactokinase [Streptomyces mashuensis]GHF64232.1 galactokinase [Streptomyces mashuensis]
MTTAARAATAFRARYGTGCAGVWAAPGRVNLIGEYTDLNEGWVLPLALPHATYVAARPRADGVLHLHSAAAPGVVRVRAGDPAPGWAAYPAAVVRALHEAGAAVGGADLHVESDVPTGAGLSSSAALLVATALALDGLYGLGLAREDIARLARHAENAHVGVPCGVMDQTASACCTEGHALHLDTRHLTYRQLPLPLAAQGLRLLVVDTGVTHAVGAGEYARRRDGCHEAARALGVRALRDVPYEELEPATAAVPPRLRGLLRHVVEENRRVAAVAALLTAGDLRAVGPWLTAGHRSLRDGFRVSCPELDLAVAAACAAGALGARMTGAGFGGSAVVLVEEAGADEVGRAVRDAFATAGFRPPRVFPAVAAAGARRVA